jgi:small-conductance mechanosensitive channel
LIDKPFQIGDRITFENVYGEIVSMGLRSIKLLTLDESVVTIPNSRFMNDIVSSSSAGQLEIMTTVDVYVPIDENLYKLKGILERAASESPYLDKEKNTVIVIKEVLGMGGVVSAVMTAKCIVKDARKEKAFQTDFLIKVNQELKNQNIHRNLG